MTAPVAGRKLMRRLSARSGVPINQADGPSPAPTLFLGPPAEREVPRAAVLGAVLAALFYGVLMGVALTLGVLWLVRL